MDAVQLLNHPLDKQYGVAEKIGDMAMFGDKGILICPVRC